MQVRRIILLFIAALALLGARTAQGQVLSRPAQALKSMAQTTPTPVSKPPVFLPYMRVQERVNFPRLLDLPTRWPRRTSPRLVLPAGDRILGSAGLVWSRWSVYGTAEVKLFLF